MARLPDLVRDSKLETWFLPTETIHIYDEPDPSSRRRLVSRSEHWERKRKIGGGGFGTVWLESCTKGDRGIKLRAIKQIEVNRQLAIDCSRELEAIAKFSHWKYERCFVKSFGWYESPDNLYIAMEYLDCGDLDTYLHHKPALRETEVKQLIGQILDGLCMMHDNQFTHRDLKPKNILLKSCPPNEWWVKIADFGISKRIEEDTNRSTTVKGTPGYIAPETYGFIKRGTPYAVDIWAAGEIMFRMFTKQPTFRDLGSLSNYTIRPETFPVDALLAARCSRLATEFVLSHMRPDPENRITAKGALLHQWIAQPPFSHQDSGTYTPSKEAHNSSTIGSYTERLASWDTIIPQRAAGTSITIRAEEPKILPRQVSIGETVKVQALYGTCVMLQEFEKNQVYDVAFSPDGELIASACEHYTIELWDTADRTSRNPVKRLLPMRRPRPRRIYRGHSDKVFGVAFSPDGRLLASASGDCTVRLWDRTTGELFRTLQGHSEPVYGVAFSPDGKLVASASADHTVRLWNLATGAVLHTFQGESDRFLRVVFSPDSKLVAPVSGDREVRVWDSATGAVRHTFQGHSDTVFGVAFSPDGKLVASASGDRTVRLWDQVTGELCYTFRGHYDRVYGVAFSPDGKLVASTSGDYTVRLWNPATGEVYHTLQLSKQNCSPAQVLFSPDGKLLAVNGIGKVLLWGSARHK